MWIIIETWKNVVVKIFITALFVIAKQLETTEIISTEV